MRQLNSLDAQFLNAETATTLTHVGALMILDPSTVPGGMITVEDLRALIGDRLSLVGPLGWRLRQVPLGLDLPYWVQAPFLDLEYHIREIAVPDPGTDRLLGEQISRIAGFPLNRDRPLWECYLVHGLAGGRQAVYLKMHLAALGGRPVEEVTAVLLGMGPQSDDVAAPQRAPEPLQGAGIAAVLGNSVWHLAMAPLWLMRSAPAIVPHLLELPGATTVPGARRLGAVAAALGRATGLRSADPRPARAATPPETPFNGPITPHRRLAFTSLPLHEVNAVNKAMGVTVEAVVLALCTTALRQWLIDHSALPETPLVAAVPVHTTQTGRGGRQTSLMLTSLPTDEPDPVQRLRLVHTALTGAAERFHVTPATLLHKYSATLPQVWHGLATRTLLRALTVGAPPFNLVISNISGPRTTLRAAGAAVTGTFPVSAITDTFGGITIKVLSYDRHLDVGIIVCRKMVPDVWDIVGHLRTALTELTACTSNVSSYPYQVTPTRS
jgi:WS/DGAT/MGAT family acyltransferase